MARKPSICCAARIPATKDTDLIVLSATQKQLVNQLESIPVLNRRYEKLHCVSVQGQKRRGVQSLVFQAYDRIANILVAIKVMDPDRLGDAYRIACFDREPQLLELVEGKHRCLQLVQSLVHYKWELTVPGAEEPLQFRCGYFVTEWIEEDADDFFFKQDAINAETKLRLFRNLLLAIEAIHSTSIFHRDLKIDNIRLKTTEAGQIVVAIDYGTAAGIETPKLPSTYDGPVGAPAFAPPEAFTGFAGDRELGHLADSYALGSLLFDLFNSREFIYVRENETQFNLLICAVGSVLAGESSRAGKLRAWSEQVKQFRSILGPPEIEGPGHTIPASISSIIRDLYAKLANFDFRNRLGDLQYALRCVDSALRALTNGQKQTVELRRKRLLRQRRQEKARQKQERLNRYLARNPMLTC